MAGAVRKLFYRLTGASNSDIVSIIETDGTVERRDYRTFLQQVRELDKRYGSLNFKVLVLGDVGVGKTTLIQRYCKDKFQEFTPTKGMEFTVKEFIDENVGRGNICFLNFSGKMSSSYVIQRYVWTLSSIDGIVFVETAPNRLTLEKIFSLVNKFREVAKLPNGAPVPSILLLNKIDLGRPTHAAEHILETAFSEDDFLLRIFETTAKDYHSCRMALQYLLSEMIKCASDPEYMPNNP